MPGVVSKGESKQLSANEYEELRREEVKKMLVEPKCFTRKCKHYTGVIQPDGTEATERNACKAFPEGIPYEIAYGDNDHTKPFDGDRGIMYEHK